MHKTGWNSQVLRDLGESIGHLSKFKLSRFRRKDDTSIVLLVIIVIQRIAEWLDLKQQFYDKISLVSSA